MTDVYAFLDEMDEAEIIAVDLETATVTGEGALFPEDGTIVVAIGFSTHPGHGRAIPLYAWGSLTKWYWTDAEVKEIVDLLTPRLIGRPIFGQNWLQHDQKWLKRFFGINRTNVVFDTMLAHYLIDEEKGTHDLEQLAIRYTKMPPWKKTFTLRDTEGLCTYLCKDVDATFRVKEPIEKGMTPNQKHLLKELLIPLGHELMEMELRGVAMNSAMVDEVAKLINGKIEEEMRRLREMPPVRAYEIAENTSLNVDDHKGLGVLMGDYFRFPAITTTPKGRYSTGKPTLEALKHEPFVQGVLKLRGLGKLKGTYVDGMYARVRKDGRIHTSYLQHGTATGRLSSQEPNLQNIPRKGTVEQVLEDGSVIKQIFQADPGYCFLQFDYSQIELRVLAMYSGDPKLIEIFESGKDIHKATAAKVYGIPLEKVTDSQRSCAKNVIFGVNYGMSEESLIYKFVTAGNTEAEAKDFLRFHKQEFSVTWKWIVGIERRMQQDNVLETFFGRKRHFEYIDKHALRQGPNFLIQSTASEFTLFSIVRTARALRKYGFDAYPLLTVHDNIVFQVKLDQLWEVATLVKHIMENLGFPFINVPVKVDAEVGLNWGKLKKINIEKQEVIGAKK
jgi:DNA polymerase I